MQRSGLPVGRDLALSLGGLAYAASYFGFLAATASGFAL
jgi:hypothetical protein